MCTRDHVYSLMMRYSVSGDLVLGDAAEVCKEFATFLDHSAGHKIHCAASQTLDFFVHLILSLHLIEMNVKINLSHSKTNESLGT